MTKGLAQAAENSVCDADERQWTIRSEVIPIFMIIAEVFVDPDDDPKPRGGAKARASPHRERLSVVES